MTERRADTSTSSTGSTTASDPQSGTQSDPKSDTQSGSKPSGSEKFAAVLAASRGKDKKGGKRTPRSTTRPSPGQTSSQPRRVRKARLRLTHVDPWSVMKVSFLLSIAVGIVTVVAVAVVWTVLGAAGVWESIDSTVGDVVGDTGSSFRIEDYLGMSRVMGFTLIVAVIDVVLITVIATLGAFLYNLAAALLGGLEVVLAEDDH